MAPAAPAPGPQGLKSCVFIHTNRKQWLGALVSAHSLVRNSARADAFDVRILRQEDYEFFRKREGQAFLRGGDPRRIWRNDDLQSFTPLRFMPPELMGYRGRALVIDPDVFAVGDVAELLARDMHGRAILCRPRHRAKPDGCMASSVMLLDCARLGHWRCEEQFGELFEGRRDYRDWICLHGEPRETLGLFEDEWNDFDRLTPQTRLLHNTKRRTQPWKTGLPADFVPAEKLRWLPPAVWLQRLRRRVLGDYAWLGRYARHPDPAQERLFFGLLRECVEAGRVTPERLREEMAQNHLRHDALELLKRTEPPEAPAQAADPRSAARSEP